MTDDFETDENENEAEDSKETESSSEDAKTNKAEGQSKDLRFDVTEGPRGHSLEVTVDHNIEKAMKILKRKLIKEGLFKELKLRRYYEKPSEKKKRKLKESLKKIRKEEARIKKNPQLYY